MNERQEQILKLLKFKKAYITSRELSSFFHVSDRTIRNDVSVIIDTYGKIITADRHKGYLYDADAKQKSIIPGIPKSRTERDQYILKKLLLSYNGRININHLIDEIYVSDSSIEKDIKRISELISSFPSLHVYKKRNWINLIGDDEDKKTLYRDLLKKEVKDNFSNINAIAKLFNEFDLVDIKNDLLQILSDNNFVIRSDYIPTIMLHVGIILNFSPVSETEPVKTESENSEENRIAKILFDMIERKYQIIVNQKDIKEISTLLKTARIPLVSQNKTDDEIDGIINRILNDLYMIYSIDFRSDEVFMNSFRLHLLALKERAGNYGQSRNLYLHSIKYTYPLIFEMAVSAKKVIDEFFQSRLGEDELNYLTLHFGAAYERYANSKRYKTFLIVPHGKKIAETIKGFLELHFGSELEIIETSSYLDESLLNQNVHLIITTSSLDLNNNQTEIVKINPFPDKEDEAAIIEVISKLDRKKRTFMLDVFNDLFIKKEFFYNDVDINTPKEIIQFMCDQLYQRGYVNDNFYPEVLQRENDSNTSYQFGFALPHPIGLIANQSAVSVSLLSEPIQWGDYKITMVIMLAISEADKDLFHQFLEWFGKLMTDPEKAYSLVNSKTYEDFISNFQ